MYINPGIMRLIFSFSFSTESSGNCTNQISNFFSASGPDGKPVSCPFTEDQLQEHFEDFYEDIFTELAKYGDVAELNVCDNLGEHLVGNVYVRF